jgi:8-oxo-dGTP pyrophosphatase MutT (NUDIX family)
LLERSCIAQRCGASFLLGEGYDRVKGQRFYRPLGGAIEPGETAEEAAIREMREELGYDVRLLRKLGQIESRFEFEGRRGWEVVHVFEAQFVDPPGQLVSGEEFWKLAWVTLDDVSTSSPLYPDGIAELLRSKLDHYR